ncbi:TonB-dependent receptor [Edaphobacter acidisoli]|uniref:TonB-dependent receptor n=1 Tax=Edaphobacter acidisoli TaxID=2040573 RepID=UPI001665EF35|nr:TonB-dependent receptor [Edaphobacter acidisoli]
MRPNDVFRLLAIFLFAAIGCLAQSPNGTMSGLVLDPDGRAIVGADIEVVNDATGVRYPGVTNSEGIYAIPNLPPGPYRVQVAKVGFKTIIKPDIVLNTQAALAINFTLPVGAASETVTVAGGAPLVETESASVSTVIDRQFVANLPLNGRSFNTLMQLTPGVVIAQQPSGTAGGSAPGQFSIGGQRTDANSFTVDGVSANFGVSSNGLYSGASGTGSAQAFSALGGTSSLVSVEALQEFRIETSSFAPEFGRTPGGQVILTTRSGTNRFHGEVYDYFRNEAMDANDWFANHAGRPRAAERHNDFGGYLGGPLVRNRTFFFFSYEGARLRLPQTGVIVVPHLDDSGCAAPAAVEPLLNAFPKPNGPVSEATCTGEFTGSYANSATLDATSLRVDHNLSSRFSLFARYNYAPSMTNSRIYSLSMIQVTPVNTQTLTGGVNMLFGKFTANTLRANYSTQSSNATQSQDTFGGAIPVDESVILGTLSKANTYASFQTLDTEFYGLGPVANNRTRQINLVDDLNTGVGAHQLKFGVDYRVIFLDKTPHASAIVMSASLVKGLLQNGKLTQLTGTTNAPSSFRTTSTSFYAQDTWKATSKITMTYGLRWELAPAPAPHGATKAAAWLNVDNPQEIALAPFGTPLWSMTYSNVAPRIGVAWTPGAKGSLVVRGGWGIFYDLGTGRAADVATFFPGQASDVTLNVALPIADAGGYLPTASLSPPYPLVSAFTPNLKLPRSYQWNAAVEKLLSGRQVVTATYVGQSGRELLRQAALYKPNPNFSSAFLLTGNTAWSNYNALQLQYRRPMSGALQLLLNYTYSHSLDNSSNDVVAGVAGTVISAASDYASSDYDVRHSFSGAFTYAIPAPSGLRAFATLAGGWSLAGVVVARSGFPFNGRVLTLSSVTGGFAYSRPDLVNGQPLWVSNSGTAGGKELNSNAFAVPGTLRQGTEGRNDIAGFRLAQADLSVARTFKVRDKAHLDFRVDSFNALNHPNFGNPAALIGFGPIYLQSTEMLNNALGGLNPLFQEGGPRSLQLSLKLGF